jgi:uncharacterized protein (DUF302 family)
MLCRSGANGNKGVGTMSSYTLARTISRPYDQVVEAVRAGLGEQGFGVLTEIDLAATMHAKLGVDLPPQVILGACRPQLAYEALKADPSIAAVLPCNVVVRALGDGAAIVEAFDPAAMVGLAASGNAEAAAGASALAAVARDARERLEAMLDMLA